MDTITFAYTVLPVNSTALPALDGTVNSIVSSYNGAEGGSMSVCPMFDSSNIHVCMHYRRMAGMSRVYFRVALWNQEQVHVAPGVVTVMAPALAGRLAE